MLLINILDIILFSLSIIWVGYLFIYAYFAIGHHTLHYPKAKREYRIAILVPAYREDEVIEESVGTLLAQDYPQEYYDIVVISDKMQPQTNHRLGKLPIKLLEPTFDQSTKAKSLAYAVEQLKGTHYDIAVIMDADNMVDSGFLQTINQVYNNGVKAMQAHRVAKNINNDTAILDAASEEINNTIFRRGHVALGLSAALSGSGMAFEYEWLERNVERLCTSGEDKELEILLLTDEIYIEYLDNTMVYDEKTRKDTAFYNQRRRWLAAQFAILSKAIYLLPRAIANRNIDLCDKLLQWTMPPRILLVTFVGFMSLATFIVDWNMSIKWWAVLLWLLFTLAMALPDYLVTTQFKRAVHKAPWLAMMMLLGMFRLRGMSRKFIHTKHGKP